MLETTTLPAVRHRPVPGVDVTFGPIELEPGERLVLFGPNGSGKTTTLRLLAGTLRPGTLQRGARLPRASYLPQRPYMFRGSGRHNLHLGLRPGEAAAAEALADTLGITGKLDEPAQELSGGERQRLALARSLAHGGDILLLDEPLSAIDARNRDLVMSVIADAVGERPAVIVTHDRDVAAALADQVAVMVDGSVRQIGSVAEVFSLPTDDEVALAVGVGNVLAGVVTGTDPPLVEVDVAGIRVWALGSHSAGAAVKVVFGAETVTVSTGRQGPSSARNVWPGTLVAVRPMGRLVELLVDAGPTVAALITPGSLDALELRKGGSLSLSLKATAARAISAPGA